MRHKLEKVDMISTEVGTTILIYNLSTSNDLMLRNMHTSSVIISWTELIYYLREYKGQKVIKSHNYYDIESSVPYINEQYILYPKCTSCHKTIMMITVRAPCYPFYSKLETK